MASSAEMEGWVRWVREAARVGRRRSTTQDHITDVALDLFASRGFDEVSVDDVAQAAGIARRTLFRYYSSKNAIPWGDFDAHLDHMRDLLDAVPDDVPVSAALRSALLAFNSFDEAETARHRQRMRVILETAALQAHSMTMYAGWRAVVAEFVARRLGVKADRPGAADHRLDHARRRALGLRALAGRRIRHRGTVPARCRARSATRSTPSAPDWPASNPCDSCTRARASAGSNTQVAEKVRDRASEFGPQWRR